MKYKYRVKINISYYDAWFDFDTAEEATAFAVTCLAHQESNTDTKKKPKYIIEVVNVAAEAENEEEE